MAKVALLIGVSEYEPSLTPLPAAVMNVQAIAKVLQHPERGGFARADVKQLVNPDPQKMQEAIKRLFGDRQKDDLVILYFSGYGIKDDSGKLYLATRLTRKNSKGQLVKETAVPASLVRKIVSDSRSKRQVVILDCWFSGTFVENLSAKNNDSVDIYTQLGGKGRVVFTSTTATQNPFKQQEAKLSTYTYYFVEGIRTGVADRDNNGVVSMYELHEYVKRKVQQGTPAMQLEIYGVQEDLKLPLAQAPISDPKLKYRKAVERLVTDDEISTVTRRTLEALRDSLGLTTEDAIAIEAEVLKPYQEYKQKLQQYEQTFVKAVQSRYPLRQETRKELRRLQQVLGLRDEDVIPIKAQIIPSIPRKNFQMFIGLGIAAVITAIAVYPYIQKFLGETIQQNAQNTTPGKISTFTDWCLQKAAIPPDAKHTINMLLKQASTQNCQQANSILSSRQSLSLSKSKIVDISPLSFFKNLTLLDLSNNQIENLTPLSSLTNLKLLNLNQNNIADVSKLNSLRNIQALYLWGNQINDITSLANLTSLKQLNLGANQIVDIKPLSSLTNIETLNLYNNQIEDVTPLRSLTNLDQLFLNQNKIQDVKSLSSLKNLKQLNLSSNSIDNKTCPIPDPNEIICIF